MSHISVDFAVSILLSTALVVVASRVVTSLFATVNSSVPTAGGSKAKTWSHKQPVSKFDDISVPTTNSSSQPAAECATHKLNAEQVAVSSEPLSSVERSGRKHKSKGSYDPWRVVPGSADDTAYSYEGQLRSYLSTHAPTQSESDDSTERVDTERGMLPAQHAGHDSDVLLSSNQFANSTGRKGVSVQQAAPDVDNLACVESKPAAVHLVPILRALTAAETIMHDHIPNSCNDGATAPSNLAVDTLKCLSSRHSLHLSATSASSAAQKAAALDLVSQCLGDSVAKLIQEACDKAKPGEVVPYQGMCAVQPVGVKVRSSGLHGYPCACTSNLWV